MASLPAWKTAFLEDCVEAEALKFGSFTLKSGRISPYFFNAGLFHRAKLLKSISTAFANTLVSNASVEFDVLFGPAYKGIPLATTVVEKVVDLDSKYDHISYSFNRKEAKDHGEGGNIVGAPLKGKRIVIIDDVITAGTAIREAIEIITKEGGQLVGIIVAIDRQEKRTPVPPEETDDCPLPSAIGEIREKLGIPVLSILTLDDIVEFTKAKGLGTTQDQRRLEEYRFKYRAFD